MNIIAAIDPLVMQLLIVPLAVIGIGVLAAVALKKVYIGPVTTLFLNLFYNSWYFSYKFPDTQIPFAMIFSWCVIFPVFSLFLSWVFVTHSSTYKNFLLFLSKEKSLDSE
ncbi:hypothetical protein B0H99_101114 [Planomicrobium soli]|uniref:Uncharacterized protein n=1 Tax=Planomicrobium soli TaxID=1176648 RepID=A0A2P8H6L5_9BACL|nr:hypothetical protein [Planomicrobium soli]PSL41868.1 hypothetical protein B0H99_101114 [Planomicrobium soli]